MKKKLFLFITIINMAISYSQTDTLQVKLDSIIKEADLLYNYEKTAWVSTDLLMSKRKLKKNYGGYVIYHSNDTIHASFIDKNQKNRIAKYSFIAPNLETPFYSNFDLVELSKKEKKLLDVKINIANQLSEKKYEVRFPQGFNPNLVLIQDIDKFKLYILMGTPESEIIPFGNDYLFTANSNGEIMQWQKFHSKLISIPAKGPNGELGTSIHSHLKTTPYITATDICTFRLYGGLYNMKEFIVLSTAKSTYYKYNIETNAIEITEL